jgi:CRISPR system Cascade subunit CasD
MPIIAPSEIVDPFHKYRSAPMAQCLIFQLYGPMAAWGEIAVGEIRATADHPTRSAVLGLVAAALGITREQEDEHQKLAAGYGFAVRLDAPGEALRDYHTAQVSTGKGGRGLATRADELVYDKKTTILSSRDYRLDALNTICLWATVDSPPWSLEAIAQALQTPAFPLFLGRKSCPLALPLRPEVVEADSLLDALSQRRLPAALRHLPGAANYRNNNSVRLYWQDDVGGLAPGIEPTQRQERWDEPSSRARWQFARREEAFAQVDRALFEEGS